MRSHIMQHMTDDWMPMMPMMGFGMLFMVLFWAAVIVGAVLLVKWLMGRDALSQEETALEILKKRYARGDINKQEFEERKRDLLS